MTRAPLTPDSRRELRDRIARALANADGLELGETESFPFLRVNEPDEICIWCPDRSRIPTNEFDAHLDRMHPEISDPRTSTSCWSRAEVDTPDGTLHEIACGRGRHRWGKHRNRHVRWSCPPRCGCIRHAHQTNTSSKEQA